MKNSGGSRSFDGTAVVLVPITAEIVHAETVCLWCEVTDGLGPMIAAAQVESAPSEAGSQSFDGTAVVLVPITCETVHVETVGLSCEVTVGLGPMIAAAQVESAPSEAGSQFLARTTGAVTITAENVNAELDSLCGEDQKKPEGRNRRAKQNRRSSQKDKNRKRKAQENAGVTVTHEAEGTKTRGAAETSSEVTHVPDPLHLTVDGGIVVDIRAETISSGHYSRPRKSKSARIDHTTSMAMAATDEVLSDDVPISQAGSEKAEVGSAEDARVEFGSSDEEPSSAADLYARPRGSKSARIDGAETIFQTTIPAAPVTFNVLLSGNADPRDMMLTGPNLSATPGNSESMGTAAAEPQVVVLVPITAEIVHAENVGLSCEVTSGPEPMIADAQVDSAPRRI